MAPMFLTFRHALIVAVIGFADVVATGGTGQAGAVEPTGGSTDGTTRPLVTLLLKCPGPTAPLDKLFRTAEVEVEQPIPDAPASGLQSDLVLGDGSQEPGSRIYGIEVTRLALTHPRFVELTITVSALSRDGKTVLKSEVVWDGPAQASGKSASDASRKVWLGRLTPNSLLTVRGCGRWRMTVTDTSPGNVGTLKTWGLTLRTARFPFAHDAAQYRRLLFGDGVENDPLVAPNVADYFREVSRDKFTYRDAGIYGPVVWEGWDGSSDVEQRAAAVHLLEAHGFDFRRFDADGNGIVTIDDLTVLVIHNDGDAREGVTRVEPGGTALKRTQLRVQSAVVFIGDAGWFPAASLAKWCAH